MSRSGVGLLVLRVLLATGMLSLAATPVAADFDQSRSWFEGLTIDERTDLQGNLILLAHYGGIVDGAFGTNTYNAIVGWQGSLGATSTGTLSEDDLSLLGQMASDEMSELGMSLVEDFGGHLAIMLPLNILVAPSIRTRRVPSRRRLSGEAASKAPSGSTIRKLRTQHPASRSLIVSSGTTSTSSAAGMGTGTITNWFMPTARPLQDFGLSMATIIE
jgi:peptidoglycan hydrolase-like protein with peptidoglycan-binding domain